VAPLLRNHWHGHSEIATGVGAPLGAVLLASQGYVAATIGLAGCFYDF